MENMVSVFRKLLRAEAAPTKKLTITRHGQYWVVRYLPLDLVAYSTKYSVALAKIKTAIIAYNDG